MIPVRTTLRPLGGERAAHEVHSFRRLNQFGGERVIGYGSSSRFTRTSTSPLQVVSNVVIQDFSSVTTVDRCWRLGVFSLRANADARESVARRRRARRRSRRRARAARSPCAAQLGRVATDGAQRRPRRAPRVPRARAVPVASVRSFAACRRCALATALTPPAAGTVTVRTTAPPGLDLALTRIWGPPGRLRSCTAPAAVRRRARRRLADRLRLAGGDEGVGALVGVAEEEVAGERGEGDTHSPSAETVTPSATSPRRCRRPA